MIVQCEACQTRFRLADEKIKPGGTKVRCSKCKEVFTVIPQEPEPVEESVDFDSFNMEKVAEDEPGEQAAQPSADADAPSQDEEPSSWQSAPGQEDAPAGDELDFSALENELGSDAGLGEELADEFSFADTSTPQADDASAEETAPEEDGFAFDEPAPQDEPAGGPSDFGDAFAETGEPGGPGEFDFGDDAAAGSAEPEPADEEAAGPAEFSFGEEEDESAFAFDETEDGAAPSAETSEFDEPGEFSFDDEAPFGEEATAEWSDSQVADDTSFDFDEPSFDNADAKPAASAASGSDDSLQFGEIDFASDEGESQTPSFQADDDFSKATLTKKEEPEPYAPKPQSAPPARDYSDDVPLPSVAPTKKSSLSRILVLLVLLLVILGGAAGFLFMQEGAINLNTVAQYLPFLQDYIGEAPPESPGARIGINIIGSSYVNGQAGQMLVIQGTAVNNYSKTRSAITIKGVLLDAQGKTLLQQTVFCGNHLDDAELRTMPFAAIEEAMNNQFGDSLSNMNIAAGASIPFTIVFRNLPAGLANINVEVVDSKPGAG